MSETPVRRRAIVGVDTNSTSTSPSPLTYSGAASAHSGSARTAPASGCFKTECIATTVFHHGPYKAPAGVECATAGWVDWYNHRRLHGSLGMLTPSEYEQAHYAAPNREPQPR